jgi:hypothetical protein
MPILGILASAITGNLVTTAYESIATVTVGSGGSSTISFTSIPATYTHLQLRAMYAGSQLDKNVKVQVGNGSIDTGSNYSGHYLYGYGTGTGAAAETSVTSISYLAFYYTENNPASFVIDLLDYANTNKYKTFRSLHGNDSNGLGQVGIGSGSWRSTSAVNQIELTLTGGSFNQHSSFALYGIKS